MKVLVVVDMQNDFIDGTVNNVEPTVTIDAIIKPIYNFKAGEEE